MNTEIYNTDWKVRLYDLIQLAKAQGKWLYCYYQQMWFKPEELEKRHKQGELMWGVDNWSLRDPKEYLLMAEKEADIANKRVEKIKNMLKEKELNNA